MTVAATTKSQAEPSRWQKMWKSISIVFESRVATVGLIMVLFWLIAGLVSLVWTPHNPNASDFVQNLGPNSTNWLGTDHLGRDILSRLMAGTQVILLKTRLPGDSNISFPIGVAAAIYLEEFAPRNRWSDLIEVNINNLAAVPSIVFGLLGLAVFINWAALSFPFNRARIRCSKETYSSFIPLAILLASTNILLASLESMISAPSTLEKLSRIRSSVV